MAGMPFPPKGPAQGSDQVSPAQEQPGGAPPMAAPAAVDPAEALNTALSSLQTVIDAKGLGDSDKQALGQIIAQLQSWAEEMNESPDEASAEKQDGGPDNSMAPEVGASKARPY